MDQADIRFIQMAISEARSCRSDGPKDPRVGAVVYKGGELIGSGHRGETGPGDHAEFGLLQKKNLRSTELLEGSTLCTTLEPCTSRSHDKLPCAGWIVRKKIRRVLIGMLDPNPNICGRGYWRLADAGIEVELFPPDQAREILDLNKEFTALHRGGAQFSAAFAWTVQRNKSRVISPYAALGWGDELSLQDSPNMREGWHVSDVELVHDQTLSFEMPPNYREGYRQYFEKYQDEKRFKPDNEKLYLYRNPTAFSDSERLVLETRSARWSEVQFYKDNVAPIYSERLRVIDKAIKGSLEIEFPHAFCMHMIVATSDSKLLLTRRSPKVAYYPGTWSASVEEQLAPKDLGDGPEKVVLNWSRRLLDEELGLDEKAYRVDDLRILSVFLESDILNVSLCAYSELNVNSETLDVIIRGHKRTDYEFTEWDFIDVQKDDLLKELLRPPRAHHPSTGYRILLTLLKQLGTPSDSEIASLTIAAR